MKGGSFPSSLGNQDGMALLTTLAVISILVVITLELSKTSRRYYFSSVFAKNRQQLHQMAASGINIGIFLLEDDGKANAIDTVFDNWANLEDEQFVEMFDSGKLQLEVEDLSGRLNVNGLVADGGQEADGEKARQLREVLNRLLLTGFIGEYGEDETRELVSALVDWIDADDKESDFGAESAYYRSLEPPYESPNDSVDVLRELLLVRGITAELLFGEDGEGGLSDVLAVSGSDVKVNINTAPLALIGALHEEMTEELVDALEDFRTDEENLESLGDVTWYKKVAGWPGDIILPEDLLTVKSNLFKITSIASLNDHQEKITAVVKRETVDNLEIVYKRVE